jgi:hypothetical protein
MDIRVEVDGKVRFWGNVDDPWEGPWCLETRIDQEGKPLHYYSRHIYDGRVFKTERINIEELWKLGYKYMDLKLN